VADLSELHHALRSTVEDGGGYKLFFYAAGKNGAALRHGFIAVVNADMCQISFEHLENERALSEIPSLPFIKIQALPMLGQNPATGSNPLLATADVLNMLDPALQTRPGPAASVPNAAFSDSSASAAHDATATVSGAGRKLTRAQLKAEVIVVLEAYYGNSAAAKVAEIEARFPPLTDPVQFLDGCRQLAAMIVGALKANEVFKDLHAKL
jgi:hypothetical protein